MAHTLVFASFLALTAFSALPDDLGKLEGKWSIKKTNEEGQPFTQYLEIKKDKFKFKIVGGNDRTFLYAEGDIKLSKLGSFNVIKFFNIKGGASPDQTDPVDDDREAIYSLDENTWTIATNFDKSRDNEKPAADAYKRATN